MFVCFSELLISVSGSGLLWSGVSKDSSLSLYPSVFPASYSSLSVSTSLLLPSTSHIMSVATSLLLSLHIFLPALLLIVCSVLNRANYDPLQKMSSKKDI